MFLGNTMHGARVELRLQELVEAQRLRARTKGSNKGVCQTRGGET